MAGQNLLRFLAMQRHIDTEKNLIIGDRKGIPVYRNNPSVPTTDAISKPKRARFGDEKKGFIVDNGSGELVSMGGATFWETEEVDSGRFVKMFLAGIKQAAGLSKAGLTMFELVYRQVQDNTGNDQVQLSLVLAQEQIEGLTRRTYNRGLRELLDKGFLFCSPVEGVFFINVKYMFNGDRLAFVKAYKRRGAPDPQPSLPLEEKPSETAAEDV